MMKKGVEPLSQDYEPRVLPIKLPHQVPFQGWKENRTPASGFAVPRTTIILPNQT